jgi:hypothetical protein
MTSTGDLNSVVEVSGLSIRTVKPGCIASIRFFDPAGEFMTGLAGKVGGTMPAALQAVRYADAATESEFILASRSPNETLLVSNHADALAAIDLFAEGRCDGCVVNQTGAWRVWEIAGGRAPDFMARLGSAPLPASGETSMSRIAELTVMTLCVEAGRRLILVDRLYADHLAGWIRETLADF